MKKLKQTRLHKPKEKPKQVGNCFPTVIACILGYDSPEDVLQIQEHYNNDNWSNILGKWLYEKGYAWESIKAHLFDDSFYLAIGNSIRGSVHVCIYKNGELFHDPHPDNSGLIGKLRFEIIRKL